MKFSIFFHYEYKQLITVVFKVPVMQPLIETTDIFVSHYSQFLYLKILFTFNTTSKIWQLSDLQIDFVMSYINKEYITISLICFLTFWY